MSDTVPASILPETVRARLAAALRAVEYARAAANADENKIENLVQHIHALSELRLEEGDYSRAEGLLREALFRVEDLRHPRHLLLANVASSLGFFYDRTGKFDQAVRFYGKALASAQRGGFDFSELVASVENNLGMIHKKAGRFLEAQACYDRALAMFEQLKGATSVEAGCVLNNLGVLYYARHQHDQAQLLHERALRVREALNTATDGATDPALLRDVRQSLQNLAAVYRTAGRAEKAEELLKRMGEMAPEAVESAPSSPWHLPPPPGTGPVPGPGRQTSPVPRAGAASAPRPDPSPLRVSAPIPPVPRAIPDYKVEYFDDPPGSP